MFLVLLIMVIGGIGLPIIAFLLFSTIWLMQKYLGLPKHEEIIFAECFIIVKYLRNNERLKAKKKLIFCFPISQVSLGI